jgi:hypothetical protein
LLYQVSYDLKGKGSHDYKNLWNAIRKFPNRHILESTWLIQSGADAKQICDFLKPHFHRDDRLIISEIAGNYNGWLSTPEWEWVAAGIATGLAV